MRHTNRNSNYHYKALVKQGFIKCVTVLHHACKEDVTIGEFPIKGSETIYVYTSTQRLDLTAQVACRLADSLLSHIVPPEKCDELRDEFRDWQMIVCHWWSILGEFG
jgi:hypothetical protein